MICVDIGKAEFRLMAVRSALGQERTFGDTIRKVCCWG
jgi:hypothetical protein